MAGECSASGDVVRKLGSRSQPRHDFSGVTLGKMCPFCDCSQLICERRAWARFLFWDSLFSQQIFVECLLCVQHDPALGDGEGATMTMGQIPALSLRACIPADSAFGEPSMSHSPNCFQVAGAESFLVCFSSLGGVSYQGRMTVCSTD